MFEPKRCAYTLLNVDPGANKVLAEIDLAPLAR